MRLHAAAWYPGHGLSVHRPVDESWCLSVRLNDKDDDAVEYDDGADDSLEDEAYDNQAGGPGHGGGRHARDPSSRRLPLLGFKVISKACQ